MVTFGEKYVERTEKALVETVVLEHCRQMPMTIDDCWSKIQPMGFSKVDRSFVADCYKRLTRDGHLNEENGRYTVTDDGREDVQKIGHVIQQVAGQFQGGTTPGMSAGNVTGRSL